MDLKALSKREKYPLHIIRWNYTYSIVEMANLYTITPTTVFRWIRGEGLKRIEVSKRYFVHSSELREFLEKNNKKKMNTTIELLANIQPAVPSKLSVLRLLRSAKVCNAVDHWCF